MPRQTRKPFSQAKARGRIDVGGELSSAGVLKKALLAARAKNVADIYGVHSYAARMHPATAEVLVEGFSKKGEWVWDPFCGSGTVLVAAQSHGRHCVGSDLNPLAVLLSQTKTAQLTREQLAALKEIPESLAVLPEADEKRLQAVQKRFRSAARSAFAPHVYREATELLAFCESGTDALLSDIARMCFSAIIYKVSNRESETSGEWIKKQIAPGFTRRLFLQRLETMVRHYGMTQKKRAKAVVRKQDARRSKIPEPVALLLSSPPYAGTYDYAFHHEMRARLLGLPTKHFQKAELGARRKWSQKTYREGLLAVLSNAEKSINPTGKAVLMLGDSRVGKKRVCVHSLLENVVQETSFELTAWAGQHRPKLGADREVFKDIPKREYCFLLTRSPAGKKSQQS